MTAHSPRHIASNFGNNNKKTKQKNNFFLNHLLESYTFLNVVLNVKKPPNNQLSCKLYSTHYNPKNDQLLICFNCGELFFFHFSDILAKRNYYEVQLIGSYCQDELSLVLENPKCGKQNNKHNN